MHLDDFDLDAPKPQGGVIQSRLLWTSDDHIPSHLSAALEALARTADPVSPRSLSIELGTRVSPVVLVPVDADTAEWLAPFVRDLPDLVLVLVVPEGGTAMAIDILNKYGAFGLALLERSESELVAIIDRALAHADGQARARQTVLELNSALDRVRSQVTAVEQQVVAARASANVDSLLWDQVHLVERIEDEANRLARYGTAFGVAGVRIEDEANRLARYGTAFGVAGVKVRHEGSRFDKAVAKVLADFVRRVDVCARRGPGDFVLICPSTDDAGMRRVGERLREALDGAGVGKEDTGIATLAFGGGQFRSDDILLKLEGVLERAQSGDLHEVVV
jgi:GGDEF domain-containing protein